jgi:3-hydroxybutyryl-CoA dehydrogenase
MKRPFSTDRPIAIIGAGVMGTKVAWACARSGLETRLFDIDGDKALDSAGEARGWSKGAEQETVGRCLSVCGSLDEALAGVQLAFENVPERLALKEQVLADLGKRLGAEAFIGSNASSLTVTPLALASGRADRFFNMNFTDPRTSKLVELMGNEETAPETLKFARDWASAIGMVPIQVRKEQLCYSMNRLWRVIKKEVLRQVAEGIVLPEEIDKAWMLSYGMDIGPCGMMDVIGLHTIASIEKVYFEDSKDPADAPPQFLLDMVERGELGVTTGTGFYKYPDPLFRRKEFLEP